MIIKSRDPCFLFCSRCSKVRRNRFHRDIRAMLMFMKFTRGIFLKVPHYTRVLSNCWLHCRIEHKHKLVCVVILTLSIHNESDFGYFGGIVLHFCYCYTKTYKGTLCYIHLYNHTKGTFFQQHTMDEVDRVVLSACSTKQKKNGMMLPPRLLRLNWPVESAGNRTQTGLSAAINPPCPVHYTKHSSIHYQLNVTEHRNKGKTRNNSCDTKLTKLKFYRGL